MSVEVNNKALVHRLYELTTMGDLDAKRELLAPNFVDHGVFPGEDDSDASANIYTIRVGGGGNLNLTKSPKNDALWNDWPSYSPDGEKIAYMGSDGEIYTINASGGGKSRVTNHDAYPQKLSWGSRP